MQVRGARRRPVRRAWALLLAVACAPPPAAETPAVPAAAPLPVTDVYVGMLAESSGRITLGTPVNVTDRAGYDNQPQFLPDGRELLYTSIRADGQADIWRSASHAGATPIRVTSTPESEYSPTPVPDGSGFSVVRVEADERQRLWRFPWDGGEPDLLLPDIEPVGYHAWIGTHQLALFVLGSPHELWLADLADGRSRRIVGDIGRSLQRTPDGGSATFVFRDGDARWIAQLLPDGSVRRLAQIPVDAEGDHAWTPGGTVLTVWSDTLRAWRPGSATWEPVADLAALGIREVTRVAVNRQGDRIALVGRR
jgi:hypothetical protein